MAINITIFQFVILSPASATILAGFASFFYADSCRRFVSLLIRSPFRDRFLVITQGKFITRGAASIVSGAGPGSEPGLGSGP